MKRTPLSRGTKQLKRSVFKRKLPSTTLGKKTLPRGKKRVKKPKIPSSSSLQKKLWELCKEIIKVRHGNTCYTTGQVVEGFNRHTGHGKPKGALPLKYKYDLRNLRPQSYHANINLGGMTDIFIAKLEREKEGLEFLEEACTKIDGVWHIKHIPPMGSMESKIFLQNKIDEYKIILEAEKIFTKYEKTFKDLAQQ